MAKTKLQVCVCSKQLGSVYTHVNYILPRLLVNKSIFFHISVASHLKNSCISNLHP